MERPGAALAQSDRIASFDGGDFPFPGRPRPPTVGIRSVGLGRDLGFQAVGDGLGQVRHPVGLTGGVETVADDLLAQVIGPVGGLLGPPAQLGQPLLLAVRPVP